MSAQSQAMVEDATAEGRCMRCGEADISPSVEAFEVSGLVVGDCCADEVIEENGQFGVGA